MLPTMNSVLEPTATDHTIFGGLSGAGDLLTRNARVAGNKTGLVYEDVRLSWREVNIRCNCFANELLAMGVQRGDRVAIFSSNCHQWVEAMFALAKIGAVLVTVNNRLSAPEVEYILTDSGSSAVISGAKELEIAKRAAHNVSELSLVIGIETGDSTVEDYETLVQKGSSAEPRLVQPLQYDDSLMLLYTSGTTGFPKGAIYTHGSTLVGMFVHVHAIDSRSTHRVMLPSPLYSAAGMAGIYCSVYVGSTSIVINFEPEKALRTLQQEAVTFTNLVPTTIQRLLARDDIGDYDLSFLEVILYGGSPIPVPVLHQASKTIPGCRFRQTFASTETGCAGTVLEPLDHALALSDEKFSHRLLSCGKPQINVDVVVMTEEGQLAPPGEVGEIAVRTEANIKGFWNNPEATQEAIREGWVYTGDMAKIDEDGYLYLVDRKKDLIVTGALNVYPSEVERVIHQHPAIYEVAVIGVPSEEWGEAVKAVVVLKPEQDVSEQDLIAFCDAKIAGFKKPKSVNFVASLPRNPTGKILRRELRDSYWKDQERKI